MTSHTSERFRKLFSQLPWKIKNQANDTFRRFKKDPYHPSLRFKRVHSKLPIYSVRVTKDYRAVGLLKGQIIIWFWIGSHADYDKLLKEFTG